MKKEISALTIMTALAIASADAQGVTNCNGGQISRLNVDNIAVTVTPQENREYSFTDKKAGFWYGRTHADTPQEWFSGWNIAKQRILSDYQIYVDGSPLLHSKATNVTVSPFDIQWQWNRTTETLALIDMEEIIVITLDNVVGDSTSISLTFPDGADKSLVHATKITENSNVNGGASATNMQKSHVNGGASAVSTQITYLLTYGTQAKSDSLVALYKAKGQQLLAQRKARMNNILENTNPLKTNLPELDKALGWITLTMDELITEQQGKGIYAGLPWFNEYWGRDMFIAMPGATLVMGQYDYTKDILKDFAQFQDKDEKSPTLGRIPNRANLQGILYNTADGTPRYVIETEDLMKYSGDASFLKEIYPTIRLSIEASLKNSTDAKGYLMHADADTWMDVMRNNIPGSPRGNRANDIQYLWYCQLMSGAHLATLMGDKAYATKWTKAAKQLARNFEKDYCDKKDTLIYDHLNTDGTTDMQLRPNQLFCFDLIKDQKFKQLVTRRCWEELVYPWGVASLAQWDPQFHPQHENWHWYHKDDAYHNGTIWLWNNGIAMQRMIEYGQKETAWKLFQNMNRQAMTEGAVGSLSENADAHPRALYKEVKTVNDLDGVQAGKEFYIRKGDVRGLTGTFLQAWSNSEQLRVWYQYFLGIRPDLMNNVIVVEPRLPKEVTDVETSVVLGKGKLFYSYHNGKVNVSLDNVKGFNGSEPRVSIIGHNAMDEEKAANNPIFNNIEFCKPKPNPNFPCFKDFHKDALTY